MLLWHLISSSTHSRAVRKMREVVVAFLYYIVGFLVGSIVTFSLFLMIGRNHEY